MGQWPKFELQEARVPHSPMSMSLLCFQKGVPHMELKDTEMVTLGTSDTSAILEDSIIFWKIHVMPGAYVMSPAVEGDPYSSNKHIKSPNCPWRSPKILTGALICSTLDSWANKRSEASQSSAISLEPKKNCCFTGGFQPRGFNKYESTCRHHSWLALYKLH